MDLGKAKLQRTGLNTLHQAIHPVHGVAWTDGKQVCLTSMYLGNGDFRFGDTNVIGQFEHVLGLYWGPLCCSGSPALLAVQHKKHVTVWQLQLSSLEHSKLLCTQTCEMSEPYPLLSQGCAWHPKSDVLAILTKRDASVLFSVRADNRRVRAEVQASCQIQCGCWTRDGTRLVVAVGTVLHSYIWNDIQRTLKACSLCPIFDVGGYICAIDSTEESQVAVATELPLDSINAGMAFDVPSEAEPLRPRTPAPMLEDDWCPDSRRRSIDSERSLALASSPHGAADIPVHILAKHRRSDPSPLIHLRCSDNLLGSGQGSSHLVLVRYERKVTTARKVSIPGILVPDIMAFDASGHIVAVASNTCNMVLVYGITAAAMPNMQQIQLQKTERPKGVCFLNNRMLLLMVGKHKSNDPVFLPSSNNTERYIIRLVTKELVCDEEAGWSSAKIVESAVNSPRIRRHSENVSREEPSGIKDKHASPASLAIQSPNPRRKHSKDMRNSDPERDWTNVSERGTSTSSVAIENFDTDHIKRMASLAVASQVSREASRAGSPRCEGLDRPHDDPALLKDSPPPKERALDELSQNMERLFARFTEVQQCLSEITDFTRNGRRVTGNYPSSHDPLFVNVTCQKQLSENVFIDERRPVLLCENKLHLGVIRDLFNLTVVEMVYGPLWIVLVEDAEGFVPLTFKPDSELTVRNGKRKTPENLPREANSPSPARPDSRSSET